jgi:phosphoheptose isomerase
MWRGSLPCQHGSSFVLESHGKCSLLSTDFTVKIAHSHESRVAEVHIAMLL